MLVNSTNQPSQFGKSHQIYQKMLDLMIRNAKKKNFGTEDMNFSPSMMRG